MCVPNNKFLSAINLTITRHTRTCVSHVFTLDRINNSHMHNMKHYYGIWVRRDLNDKTIPSISKKNIPKVVNPWHACQK